MLALRASPAARGVTRLRTFTARAFTGDSARGAALGPSAWRARRVGGSTALSRRCMSASAGQGGADATVPGAGAGQAPTGDIFEATAQNFQAAVMQSPVPVILDCYADWCGPCKQLTPMLEAAVQAAGGRVKLAKLNVDKESQLAGGLGVQSIPAVFGIHQGRLVDKFQGAVPPEQIKTFIDALVAAGAANGDDAGAGEEDESPAGLIARANEALEDAADAEGAAALFQRARKLALEAMEPQRRAQAEANQAGRPTPSATANALEEQGKTVARATAGLAQAALAAGRLEDATAVVDSIREDLREHLGLPEVAKALSAVHLAAGAGAGDADIDALRKRVAQNRKDVEAHMALARALQSQGLYQEAVDHALKVMLYEPGHEEGEAREFLVKVFDVLGPESEITKTGRSRLANLLYR